MRSSGGDKQQKRFFLTVVTLMGIVFVYILSFPVSESQKNQALKTASVVTTQSAEEEVPASTEADADEEVFAQSRESLRLMRKAVKVRGIYVSGPTAGNTEKMDSLISLADTTPVNAMVIDVKNDAGEITYHMNYDDAEEIHATKNYISDMSSLLQKLKEKNIYTIARIVVFKDPILAEEKPEYSIKNQDGSIFHDKQGLSWVNPYNKGVWSYVINVAMQAARAGFDEIQFDYIRFSTDSNMENVSFGGLEDTMTRQEAITDFTKHAYSILKSFGVCVSADVYGGIISSETDAKIVGQNYQKMSEYLDYISPMIYPSQYSEGSYGIERPDNNPFDIVYKVMEDSNLALEANSDGAVARPWLQGFTASWVNSNITYGSNELRAQIKAVYETGNDQWIIWNASNRYDNFGLEYLEVTD